MGLIVWVDSDPNVQSQMKTLEAAKFRTRYFGAVQEAMDFISENRESIVIDAVITSTMQRDGRKEQGLPSGFDLADFIVNLYSDESYKPLLAFVTASTDRQVALEKGFSIYSLCDRKAVQKEVVNMLSTAEDRDFRKVRAAQIGCNFSVRAFAREILEYVTGNRFADFHSSFADSCFCHKCENEKERICYRAGEKYALPLGWFGFGIHLRQDFQARRSEIENWHVAYHGTKSNVIYSVLNERRIMFPGDTLKDGTKLQIRLNNCHGQVVAKDGKVIYVSPSIYYSSHQIYAVPFDFKGKTAQIVLQCRVKPNGYTALRETLNGGRGVWKPIDPSAAQNIAESGKFDPEFSNNKLEWVVADREAVVPYRVLVRWF